MRKRLQFRLLHWWMCCLVSAVWSNQTQSAAVDPLEQKWMSEEEMRELVFNRRIVVKPDLAGKLRAYVDKLPDAQKAGWGSVAAHIEEKPPYLLGKDVNPFLRFEDMSLVPILRELAEHDDPVVKFWSLVALAGSGQDKEAAARLLRLAAAKDFSKQDAWILQNLFHGIGIDPEADDAGEVFRFLSMEFGSKDVKLPPGTAAPDFEIKSLTGKLVKLSDYRGRTVLLHFWALGCPGCVAEMPELRKEVQRWKGRDKEFVTIGVNLDDDLKEIKAKVAEFRVDCIHVCDGRGWGSKPAKLFRINSIPSDVVIDRKGIIRSYERYLLDHLITSNSK